MKGINLLIRVYTYLLRTFVACEKTLDLARDVLSNGIMIRKGIHAENTPLVDAKETGIASALWTNVRRFAYSKKS